MTDFQVHTIETAPADSKPLLEKSKKAYGMVPNLHAVMAESPALLEAYRTVADIFDNTTNLSTIEQQIIAMTNNRLNGCTYCMAAHTSIMQGAKVPEDTRDCSTRSNLAKKFRWKRHVPSIADAKQSVILAKRKAKNITQQRTVPQMAAVMKRAAERVSLVAEVVKTFVGSPGAANLLTVR